MNGRDDKTVAAIREAAQAWVVRLADAGAAREERANFTAWLRMSPVHVREYLRAEATWQGMQEAGRGDRADVTALLRQARAGPDNVVEMRVGAVPTGPSASPAVAMGADRSISDLPSPASGVAPRRTRRTRTHRAMAAAAVAALALAAIGAVLPLLRGLPAPGVYATEVGEMRRVMLADGSAVELNTDSELRIDFGSATRDIHLVRGEAFFSVAKDPQRPFRVVSGTVLVRAVGTEFSVYRKPAETVVTVVEGRVAVQPRDGNAGASRGAPGSAGQVTGAEPASYTGAPPPPRMMELSAGHRLHLAAASTLQGPTLPAASTVDAQRAVAWRQRRLVFENDPLAEIVAEFNRYNRQQLEVRDPRLAARRISGVFDPGKPMSLVRFLSRDGDVTVHELADQRLLIARGDENSR